MRASLESAIKLGFRQLEIESDSLQLLRAISTGSSFSDLHGFLSDISSYFLFSILSPFKFIARENVAADQLAKQALLLFALNFNE